MERDYVAPRNEVERLLAEIWAGKLKLKRVGITDNFFGLGGDSILTIQVVARAHEKGLELTPKQMFEYQTIEELARVVGKREGVKSGAGDGERESIDTDTAVVVGAGTGGQKSLQPIGDAGSER